MKFFKANSMIIMLAVIISVGMCDAMDAPTEFHYFPQLPGEIQGEVLLKRIENIVNGVILHVNNNPDDRSRTLSFIAYSIQSLAQVNKNFKILLNRSDYCLKIIKLISHKINIAADQYGLMKLSDSDVAWELAQSHNKDLKNSTEGLQGAADRLELQNLFKFAIDNISNLTEKVLQIFIEKGVDFSWSYTHIRSIGVFRTEQNSDMINRLIDLGVNLDAHDLPEWMKSKK